MAAPAQSLRYRFARRCVAVVVLVVVHTALLGSGWVLAGELGLLLAMFVVSVVEARVAKYRVLAPDKSRASVPCRPKQSKMVYTSANTVDVYTSSPAPMHGGRGRADIGDRATCAEQTRRPAADASRRLVSRE